MTGPDFTIRRSTRGSRIAAVALGAGVALLAAAPAWLGYGDMRTLVDLFVLLTLAQMWNLLAGYAGLVSIGQQAYVGIGAYSLYVLADNAGLNIFVAVLAAGLVAGAFAIPTASVAFRLRGGYFAIGTWVIAEVYHLLVVNNSSLGGGTGVSILSAAEVEPDTRQVVTYWFALALGVGSVLFAWWFLRSRVGLRLTSIRDGEEAAEAFGVNVRRTKYLVYVLASIGCGLAGAVNYLSLLRVQPDAAFTVNWSAYMIFIVVIGGLGTIEGPIIGTLIYFALREGLAGSGTWYLIVLGLIAVVVTVRAPGGIWGELSRRFGLSVFPTGRRLEVESVQRSLTHSRPELFTEP